MEKASDNFDIRDRLGYRVQNLSNKMILWATRTYARKFNVGAQEWRVLTILVRQGEWTAKNICDFTMMDKGNVSRAIRKLVQDGCLKDKLDTVDKRRSVLTLTVKGRKLYHRIKKVSDAREKKFMSSLSTSEKKGLPIILTKLDCVIEELLQETEDV
jgi:DNA-binding MarR family transcriptional regulator